MFKIDIYDNVGRLSSHVRWQISYNILIKQSS